MCAGTTPPGAWVLAGVATPGTAPWCYPQGPKKRTFWATRGVGRLRASPPRAGRRRDLFLALEERSAEASARDCCLPVGGPIRTPSLEVVNVAGDSAVGRDRIQSAPNLRRVHAESAQQHRRRIWWLESEDLGQHLLGRDLELPAVGLDRFLKHFLCRGRHAEAILFRDVSDPRLLRHGAHRQWGSVGAGSHAQGTQGFVIERLKGLASLLQAHAQHDFDRGILQQGEQDVIGASSAITSATSLLTGPHIDGPAREAPLAQRIRWS